MLSDVEDLIININSKVGRIVDIENLVEKIINEKPEVVEMNPHDREVVISEIRKFENELSETLREVFKENLELSKNERLIVTRDNYMTYNKLLQSLQNKLSDFQKIADSCNGLDVICKNAINQAVDLNSIKQSINHTMVTTVKESLAKLTRAIEKSTQNFNQVTVEMRKLLKKSLHVAFVLPTIVIVLLAFVGGIGTNIIWTRKTCADVYERFYSNKYEAEIAKPLAEAKKEAADYAKKQKAEADEILARTKKEAAEDLKGKKAEAEKYRKEQMEDARKRAQEEYERRMKLYDQRVHNDVDAKMKKSNSKEEK